VGLSPTATFVFGHRTKKARVLRLGGDEIDELLNCPNE